MLAQKIFLSFSSKVLLQFMQLVASVVVARVAGPSVLGTIAFGLSYVSLFQFIVGLGFGSAHIKLVSEGRDLGKCISTYAVINMVTTALFFISVTVFFLFQKFAIKVQFESSSHQIVIVIFIIMLTVKQIFNIPNFTFAGRLEQAKQDIPEIGRNIFLQFSRILVVLLGFGAVALALVNLLSLLLLIPFVWYLFRNYPFDRFDKELARDYLKIAVPLIAIGMSTALIRHLDKVILQFFTDSKEVGYYAAGYRIGGFVSMIAASVGMLLFPVFSKKIAEGNIGYIKEKIQQYERFCFLFIMPLVIFLVLYSDTIVILILGQEYTPSIPVLSVIIFSMFIMLITMPYGNLVTGMGYFKVAAVVNIIKAFVFVLSLYVLVNPGLLGLAALGAAYAIFLINVMTWIVNKIFIKIKVKSIPLTQNFEFFIFGIVNYIIFYFIYNHFCTVYGLTFKLVFPVLYFLVTYLLLASFKLIKKKDLSMLFSFFNLKIVNKYVKSEIIER